MAINKRLIKSNDEAAGGASFNTVLYTGNSSGQSVTGVGFQPDFTWLKNRSITQSHHLIDSVRGTSFSLNSNKIDAEVNIGSEFSSFDSDGFTLGSGTNINNIGNNYVAWCWKAGGAAVTNTDGTITSQVSANTEAGFSIVSYTGNGANGTVGHGLGTTPNIVLTKRRNSTSNWSFNGNFGGLIYGTNKLTLNTTSAIGADTNEVLAANSSTFTAGTSGAVGASGGTYVAYCFAEVAGFSKFGSYTGVSGGVTIDVGFEPAFVMVKCYDNAEPWIIIDNKRGSTKALAPSSSDAEYSYAGFTFTFTSTGFSFPDQAIADATLNQGGYNYIYMAFANQF